MDSARTGTSVESIMVFPHPFGILQNDRTRARPEQQNPWRSIGMTNRRLERRGDIVVLTYSVFGREGRRTDPRGVLCVHVPAGRGCMAPDVPQ